MATIDRAVGFAPSAQAFAAVCYAGQCRESDGAPYIEHPLEVAQLLLEAGCSGVVITAGLLHDVMEDADIGLFELSARFGAPVADLVHAVTDYACVESYRQRKRVLREQVRLAGEDAALLFAADKISKVREWPKHVRRDQARLGDLPGDNRTRRYLERHYDMRLEHYRASLAMLEHVVPGHPLVRQLAQELERCCRGDGPLLM